VLFRSDELVIVVLIVAALIPLFVRRESLRLGQLLVFAVPITLSVVWILFYNHAVQHNALDFGYPDQGFTFPFFSGLSRQLISPGKGFFFYNPILLVALPGLVLLWRRDRNLAIAVFGMCLARVLFYASWWDPDGSVAWGPRFLLPWCALLAIPLGEFVMWLRARPITARIIGWFSVTMLAAASAFVVWLSVWVDNAEYYFYALNAKGGRQASNDTFGPLNPIMFAFDHLSDPQGSVPLGHPNGSIPLDWWHGGPSAVGVAASLVVVLMVAMTTAFARRSTFERRSVRSIDATLAWAMGDNPAQGKRPSETQVPKPVSPRTRSRLGT